MKQITLDCAQLQNEKQLHQALMDALALPQWYGHNLDALFDCLTDLEEQTHLTLKNWDTRASYSKGFEAVFADAAQEGFFGYTIA